MKNVHMAGDRSEVIIKNGTYQHSKTGKRYEVIGVSTHTETDELLVIYRPLYECKQALFARPLAMFLETVSINGELQPRFVCVAP